MGNIIQEGTPLLRQTAKPLPKTLFSSRKLADIIDDMTKALDKEPDGVALAAPQISVSYRLFIVRKDRTLPLPKEGAPLPPADVQVFINPEIVKTSRKRIERDEGCLSVRGKYGTTKRHERVTISAFRPDGTKFERGAGGLMAQIFEHEIDHLNGILFIDHAEHLITVTTNHGIVA
jgi:peptide deformylase